MTFTVFSVALVFMFATIAAVEIYRALKRGHEKTLILLGSLIFSAILSLIISPSLSGIISRVVMNSAVRPMKEYKNLIRLYPSADASIEAVASGILSTLIFVILFFILKLIVSWVVAKIVNDIDEKNKAGDRRVESSFAHKNETFLSILLGTIE